VKRFLGAVVGSSLLATCTVGTGATASNQSSGNVHDKRAGSVAAIVRIPENSPGYGGFAAGEGSVWAVSNPIVPTSYTTDEPSELTRIDPATNKVVARIEITFSGAAAAGDGAVWLTNPEDDSVTRLDPQTNKIAATIPVGPRPDGVAVSNGAVWVANRDGPSVSRIDPATNRVVATIRVGPKRACCAEHMSVTTGGGKVWVAVPNGNVVVRIDPAKNAVTATVHVQGPCGFLAASGRATWVAGAHCAGGVTQVDAGARKPNRTVRGKLVSPIGLALASGSLWTADLDARTIVRINPRTRQVVGRLKVGGHPVRLAAGYGSVWVQDDAGRVLRIDPSRL
jgi:YVTN family beta-propeller protein